jgi:RND family efflux transporter MFP subunit
MQSAMTPNEPKTINNTAPAADVKTAQEPLQAASRNAHRRLALAFAVVTAFFAALIFYGIHSRASAEVRLQSATERSAILSVDVAYPKPSAPAEELILPGAMQAFIDSPIYARTDGYLKRWYVDIGSRVTKGELLAEIETPELDQQLQQARADLATAEANLNLSKITSERDQNLLKTHSVSTQERDNAVNGYAADIATVQSRHANVSRLEQLQAFEKVVAPFDGVITARKTDIGALIDSGANAPQELFHIAAINKLRVYVSVPEPYAPVAKPGTPAELTLDEFPGRTFHGILVRTSDSIDYSSRTLLVEVDVDNPTRELMPGSYTQVHFKLPDNVRSVVVPANALLFRKEGLQVGVVRNGKAELVNVTPGHDYGDSMEIVSGLQPNDAVIVNPSDSLTSGTPVQISRSPGASTQ